MYGGCRTKASVGNDGSSLEIILRRGVKQGDPLSPLLFNLIIETLVEKLDKTTEDIKLNGENVSILAFADDLVIFARNKEQARKQLQIINKYLSALGMSAQAEKCATFQVIQSAKTWYLTDPQLKLHDRAIPYTKT